MSKRKTIPTIEQHQESLVKKLTSVKVSGKFAAMIDAMFDVTPRRTNPAFNSLIITSDGFLMGMLEGDIGYNEFIGHYSDLKKNLEGLAKVAEINVQERALMLSRLHAIGAPI